MTWTKLPDDATDRTWDLSDSAYRLHIGALVHANRTLSDGVIPKARLAGLVPRLDPAAVQELVGAGHWAEEGDTYRLVTFQDDQVTRDEVMRLRAQSKARQARLRRRRLGLEEPNNAVSHAVTNTVTNAVSHATPTRPDPTRPVTPSSLRSEGGPPADETHDDQQRQVIRTIAEFVQDKPRSPTTKAADSLIQAFGEDRVLATMVELQRNVQAGQPALNAHQLVYGAENVLRPIPRPDNPRANGKVKRKGYSNLQDMERGFDRA
jgi:hypothetical protein